MCMHHAVSEKPSEAFAERMLEILNEGSLAIMISIGHRTELFDTMAQLPAATSQQIADAANLNERYVREWLGAMVVGRIVDYNAEERMYYLPRAHSAWLTRTVEENLARLLQYISLMGQVEDRIVEVFRDGGGVPYAAYPRFQEVMAEDSDQAVVATLSDAILPLVPGLIEHLQQGIQVLDVGCGSGRALNTMAQIFPNSHFTGYDISEKGIAAAQAEAAAIGLSNVSFKVQDVACFDECECYDLVTAFDAIHDQAHPARVLANIYRALRQDGIFLMQDIAGSSHLENNMEHPIAPFLYTASTTHCMTVSLAAGGEGLGTMWGKEKALEMLAGAGFVTTRVEQLPHDIANYYYISTKVHSNRSTWLR
jgi:2-polyprenyl-3-methyl-5-hydroxy-6-metoxy-1,4-benzoquinol methylase